VTIRTGAIGAGLMAAALGIAAPVSAQDVFSLPPGTASPTARPAGPVDGDSPVVRPRPVQTVAAQPSPSPTAAPTAAATATPSAPRARPPGRAAETARPTPRQPASAVAAPPALPATETVPSAVALPTTTPTAPAADGASDWAAFATGALVGALALLALVGGLIWRRRKPDAAASPDLVPPVVPATPAAPEPVPVPTPLAEAPAAEPAGPEPAAAPVEAQPDGLQIVLEARRLDASIMATTLAYTLRLTNHGAAPLTGLGVEADMVAAHASLPVEQQIASPADRLELRHTVAALGPGESAELSGEMRLPLSAITPIRAGDAAFFVPLARLRVNAADGAAATAQTFVVGELPLQPGAALRPFRLDLGPRTYSKLGQRAVG